MIKTLSTAATGIEAQQARIQQISNDIANANTDSYKRSRTEFADLMYETIKEPGAKTGEGSRSPVGIQRGMGVKVNGTHKIFEQGQAKITGKPYDFMVEGSGFFPVQLPNGEIGFTRNGAFHLDAEGRLNRTGGARLIPEIVIPANAVEFRLTPKGEAIAVMENRDEVQLGQIQLVNFQNPEGLHAMGNSLYKPTPASGDAIQGVPGENGMGVLGQGSLEASNVNIANSMVDMIATQRAYEMNTKVMSVADQMMGAIVNVK